MNSGEKDRISASIDAHLKRRLDNKNINKSQLIENLLQEYLAQGESTTVALKLLKKDLKQEKQDKEDRIQTLEHQVESLEMRIDEIDKKIKERREAGLEGVSEIVQKVKNDEMNSDYLTPDNPVIQEKASQAGVPTERFVNEVQQRL